MAKQKKQYSTRKASQFNRWRAMFQFLVCKIGYMVRLKLVYRIEVHGLENVPKDNKYIICPNHLSTLDPPLICAVMPRCIAFMAKKELFDILENYSWPGNIRELDAVIQRYILISDKNNDTILMNKIINDIKFANITNSQNKNNKIISINNMSLHDCLQNTEKEIITNYLISSNNKKDAAKKLGISTNTLWRKIKEHNISI